MPKSSRRSGESGTASGSDPFSRARTQLTLFYLAIIVVIVAVLSAAVYAVHMNDLRRSIHERLERMEVRGNRERFEDSLTDYTDDLRRAIIFGDLATVIGVGGLSYLLAGRTQRPIRLAMDAQKRFLTDAAHDLRTPLAVMRTEAEVALERKDLTRDEAVQVIGSQLEEISRLSLMVDQILTLMRGAEVERRARGPVPLAQVAASVVQKLGGLAARRGVRLDFAGRSDGVVRGDRVALERALVNVVENPSLRAEVLEALGPRLHTFWKLAPDVRDLVVMETVVQEAVRYLPMEGSKDVVRF